MDEDGALELARKQADYAEVRVETLEENRLNMEDGDVQGFVHGEETGFFLRVLVKGAWGTASSNDLSSHGWRAAVERAVGLARSSAGHSRRKVKLADAPTLRAKTHWKPKKDPRKVSVEDRLAKLKAIEAEVRQLKPIASVSTGLADATISKRYLNSEGTDLEWSLVRSLATATFTARRGAELAQGSMRIGGTRGWELFDLEDPVKRALREAEIAVKMLDAKAAKGGKQTVVIDGELAGVFAHEAVGHASEADLVAAGESCFRGKMGKKLGIDGLSIRDDSLVPGGFGSFPYDDTGVAGQSRPILKDGTLVGYLADREHGARLGVKPNGSARAQDYTSRPLVRMSNTLIDPGEHTKEEVFEGIKDGVYCVGSKGGQVDTARGTFLFNAREAYRIQNGRITTPLKDVSLTGGILSTLHSIDALGDTFELGNPGHCGKGQWVPVCDGGPLVRIRDCLVGGSS